MDYLQAEKNQNFCLGHLPNLWRGRQGFGGRISTTTLIPEVLLTWMESRYDGEGGKWHAFCVYMGDTLVPRRCYSLRDIHVSKSATISA